MLVLLAALLVAPQGPVQTAPLQGSNALPGSTPFPPPAVVQDPEPGSGFGAAVGLSGDTLVVGAPEADIGGVDQGAVFVYTVSPGSIDLAAILVPSTPNQPFGQFGAAVSIDGDTLAVGYPWFGGGLGQVYVYERGAAGWTRVATLDDSEVGLDNFGSAVALDGDTLAVGAPGSCVGLICDPSEKVQVFERDAGGPDAWDRTAWLGSLAGSICMDYGTSVDLAQDTLVTSDGPLTTFCGGFDTYVYRRDLAPAPFGLEARLQPPVFDGTQSLALNGPVATSGELIASAAAGYTRSGVSVYERAGGVGPWTRIAALTWPPAVRHPWAVTMDERYLVVGRERAAPAAGGEVELRLRDLGGTNAYGLRGKLFPDDGLAEPNRFGAALALDGSRLAVGGPSDATQGSGAVYLYDLP